MNFDGVDVDRLIEEIGRLARTMVQSGQHAVSDIAFIVRRKSPEEGTGFTITAGLTGKKTVKQRLQRRRHPGQVPIYVHGYPGPGDETLLWTPRIQDQRS